MHEGSAHQRPPVSGADGQEVVRAHASAIRQQASICSCTVWQHARCPTMSSNDSMGGAGLPAASSTTMFSRFRVSSSCSSVNDRTRADGFQATDAAGAASADGDSAPACTWHAPGHGSAHRRVGVRERMHKCTAAGGSRCLSSDAELSVRPPAPKLARSEEPLAGERDGLLLPPPLRSRRCGGTYPMLAVSQSNRRRCQGSSARLEIGSGRPVGIELTAECTTRRTRMQ